MSLVALPSAQSSALVASAGSALSATRTSTLPVPTLHLAGHSGAVNAAAFSPDGTWLATGGQDCNILLWDLSPSTNPATAAAAGPSACVNTAVLSGHRADVLQLAWTPDSALIASAAADGGAFWDAETATRVKRLRHRLTVTSVATARSGPAMALTGSDDKTAALWEPRCKEATAVFNCPYQVTAVALTPDAAFAFTGGLDEVIRCWDPRRTEKPVYTLQGHTGTVTGLSVSPDGTLLLSNGSEGALRTWDCRPFCPGGVTARPIGAYGGLVHDPAAGALLRCAVSPDGERFVAGSSDGVVNVWDRQSYKLVHQLGGHKGAVNDVAWHPKMPVLASASDDKSVILGELPLTED